MEMTYAQFVGALAKPGAAILEELHPEEAHLMHMLLGLAGEVGELVEGLGNSFTYGQDAARENVIEELGDIDFYLQGIRNIFEIKDEIIATSQDDVTSKDVPAETLLRLMVAVGKLIDTLKKEIIYGRSFDMITIILEMKVIDYELHKLRNDFKASRDEIRDANVAKLSKRYPDIVYKNTDAIARADKTPE